MTFLNAKLNYESMNTTTAPTIIVLIFGAAVGVYDSSVAATVSYTVAGMVNPLAAFLGLPAYMAFMGAQLSIGLMIIPAWALIGGGIFANNASGGMGSAARNMGVTLLPEGHPIVNKVQEMAKAMKLPPVAYVGHFDCHQINAFACGQHRDNAMIAFSRGCLEKLNGDEFEAVLGHELAHIANNDMSRMTYARGVQSALTFFLIFRQIKILVRWLFTFVSEISIMSLSRKREYYADAIGAVLTSPEAMVGALTKIQGDDGTPRHNQQDYANLMFSANANGMFRTHPPLESRIAALKNRVYIHKLPLN